jgi:cell division protease FtsH
VAGMLLKVNFDDEDLATFGRTFQRFLEAVTHATGRGRNELVRRLTEHLGADPLTLPMERATWPPYEHVNVYRAVEACLHADDREAELVGVGTHFHGVEGLSHLVEAALRHNAVDVGPVERVTVPVSPIASESVVALGLYLARVDGLPLVVLLSSPNPRFGIEMLTVDVLCRDAAAGDAFLEEVRREAIARSVFRGQVLSFHPTDFGPGVGPIRFHERPRLGRDELILPEGRLDLIERQILGIAEHRERLRAAGQHLKRGVLLHGPPGTGKTHTVRYLLSRLDGFTVVLLAGQTFRFIGEACALARLLQPALVVLEDCDLVAEDRDLAYGPQPLLFEVLNELDGIAEDADVVFLLTTNRPDLLEPALAQRPGRVDQAVEIPLPDEEARRALFTLYTRDVDVAADVDMEQVIARTAGATASLMKELARRAVLLSAIENRTLVEGTRDTIAGRHVTAALDELSASTEIMTRRLLGAEEGGDVPTGPGPAGAGPGIFRYGPLRPARWRPAP